MWAEKGPGPSLKVSWQMVHICSDIYCGNLTLFLHTSQFVTALSSEENLPGCIMEIIHWQSPSQYKTSNVGMQINLVIIYPSNWFLSWWIRCYELPESTKGFLLSEYDIGRRYTKRSLMSGVVVIPKEGWAPILLLVWHRLLRFLFWKKNGGGERTHPSFGMTMTHAIRDLFLWRRPIMMVCLCNLLFLLFFYLFLFFICELLLLFRRIKVSLHFKLSLFNM